MALLGQTSIYKPMYIYLVLQNLDSFNPGYRIKMNPLSIAILITL